MGRSGYVPYGGQQCGSSPRAAQDSGGGTFYLIAEGKSGITFSHTWSDGTDGEEFSNHLLVEGQTEDAVTDDGGLDDGNLGKVVVKIRYI